MQPQPVGCRTLIPLELPEGTTAQQVIEKQQAVILGYEQKIEACAR